MNYERFINQLSAQRPPYALRYIPRMYAQSPPGTIKIAGGMPNPRSFPFEQLDVWLRDGTKYKLSGATLDTALQYQDSMGYAPLMEKLKEYQTHFHQLGPKFWDTRDLIMITGGLDGICKAIEMSLEAGEPIIYQEPCYPGVLSVSRPHKARMIPATQDEFGICPKKLREVMEREGTAAAIRNRKSNVPKLLYLNPTGSNPTGATIPLERRKQIYKIACEYDLLILEDDPYYFLQFEKVRPTSFLSLDTEGRVLRFDSFSKILSSGIRLGYVTGPKPLIERIELHQQISVMQPSSLAQVIVFELLKRWGLEGFETHLDYIQSLYRSQKDQMLLAANKHLTGLAEWSEPTGGMFLWLRVHGITDVMHMVKDRGLKRGVILISGHSFMIDENAPCAYIRVSYSTASYEEMDKGMARLAELIKEEQMIEASKPKI